MDTCSKGLIWAIVTESQTKTDYIISLKVHVHVLDIDAT